jgi:hypothetical protein
MKKDDFHAVASVRSIRDRLARQLAGKTDAEVREFFRGAAERARAIAQAAKVRRTTRPST